MKRVLITGLLLSACSGAFAAWTEVGGGSGYTDFIDRSSIRKSRQVVRMKSMREFQSEQSLDGYSFFSRIDENEYDCQDEQWRRIALVVFPRHKAAGRGQYLMTQPPKDWVRVPSDGLERVLWNTACGR